MLYRLGLIYLIEEYVLWQILIPTNFWGTFLSVALLYVPLNIFKHPQPHQPRNVKWCGRFSGKNYYSWSWHEFNSLLCTTFCVQEICTFCLYGRNCSSYSQPKFSIELQSILYMLQYIIKCNVQLLVNKLACNYTVPKRFDWDGRQRNWL